MLLRQENGQKGKTSNGLDDEKTSDVFSDFATRLSYFDKLTQRLIDCIPPNVFFEDKDFQEELRAERKAKTDGISVANGKPLSDKTKHKKLKLDPDSKETVTEIIKKKFGMDDDEVEDETDDGWGRKKLLKKQKANKDRGAKINDLKEVLKRRIADFRSKRKAETQAKKKKQRESKKERKENNRKKPGAKQKGFIKKPKEEGEDEDGDENGSPDKKASKEKNGKIEQAEKSPQKEKQLKKSSTASKSPEVFNKDGNVIFSKFDLVAPPLLDHEEKKKEKKKKLKTKNKNDLQVMLKKAEKHKSIIADLESSGQVEEAFRVKSQTQWRHALAKSEGEKVRDNPELIKKSIKRIDKGKKKSSRDWAERDEHTKERKEKKLNKRDANLKKRKDTKKEKKIKQNKKQGRVGKL